MILCTWLAATETMEVAVNGEAEPRDHKLKMFSICHLKVFLDSLQKLQKEKTSRLANTHLHFCTKQNVVFNFFNDVAVAKVLFIFLQP